MTARYYRKFNDNSFVRSCSFLPPTSPSGTGTLRIRFSNGATYQYRIGKMRMANFLLDAATTNAGLAFQRNIKGQIKSTKLPPRRWK
jgi:hypothetical protein